MNQYNLIQKESASAVFIIIFISLFVLANLFGYYNLFLFFLTVFTSAIIAFFYPRSGVAATIFLTFIFERFFTLQPILIGRDEYKIYPLDIILISLLTGALFNFLISKNYVKMGRAGLFLATFIVLSYFYFLISVFVFNHDFNLSFTSLKHYAFYSLLYFAIVFLFQKREQILWLLKFGFAGALGIIFFVFYGLLTGHGLWSDFTPLSTEGVRILAFTHAFYLSMALIFLLIYILYKNNHAFEYDKKLPSNLIFYLIIGIWIIGIIGSMMRHLWGSLFIVLVVAYFVLSKKEKRKYTKVAIGSGMVFLLFVSIIFYLALIFPDSKINTLGSRAAEIIYQRIESLTNVSVDESFAWRSAVWKEAADEYFKNPFFGIGFGKKIYTQIEKYKDYVEIRNIHNSYLVILFQMGIVAIIVLSFFASQVVKEIKNIFNKNKDWISMSLVLVLIGMLVNFAFQPYLETNLLGIFFWITLGLISALSNISRNVVIHD